MKFYTLKALKDLLAQKKASSLEITQDYLTRIKKLNSTINAFITVTEELALTQAKDADARIAKNEAASLTGLPIAQKDNFCTKGVKTSMASKMLDNFIAPYDAHIIEKFNQEGSVMLGKLNMDEFAMGSSTETSYYGITRNPWDFERIPGGSSGGSSAAIAAGLTPAATGTDTGGSIRQPAAMTGITGLKPTYGRVSRYGMIAFASSLDQAGPMAQTAEDCALLMNVMAGFDTRDSTSAEQIVPDYTKTLNEHVAGLKIGVPDNFFTMQGLDSKMTATIEAALKQFESMGAKLVPITLPHCNLALQAYYVIAPAECSSNLSRFDGVRFGYRCENPKDLNDLYMRSRGEGFGKEVKRRILIGTYVLSAGFYDSYYRKAQQLRHLIMNDFQEAFKKVDVIMSPTTPTPAFKLGEKAKDSVGMYLSDVFTLPINLAGVPALSLPAGFINNLPVGLQIIGPHFSEAKLLNVAHQYQQVTDWHTQHPNIEV